MEKKPRGAFRGRTPKFWQLLFASVILLGAFILITSPNLGKPDPASPQALYDAAMALKDKGEYEEARAKLELVASKKPATPAVFLDAEKQMEEVRQLALKAKKEAEEKAAKEQEAQQKKIDEENQQQQNPPDDNQKDVPDVDLPELPNIGGGL